MSQQPTNRSRPFRLAFGLRTLFVVIALVGLWLHAQVRWIDARRALLARQQAVFHQARRSIADYEQRHRSRWKYIHRTYATNGTLLFSSFRPAPEEPRWVWSRPVLWLMREDPQPSMQLIFAENDHRPFESLRNSARVRQAVAEAQRLFPEAEICWTAYYTGPDLLGSAKGAFDAPHSAARGKAAALLADPRVPL